MSDTTNREMNNPTREGVTEIQERNLPPPLPVNTQVSQALTERCTPSQTLRSSRVVYSSIELLEILSIIEEILPIGPEEWAKVERRQQETYVNRDVLAIRHKYNNLHHIQAPTGDPNCPDSNK